MAVVSWSALSSTDKHAPDHLLLSARSHQYWVQKEPAVNASELSLIQLQVWKN